MRGQHRRQQSRRQAVLLRGRDIVAPRDELEQRGPCGHRLPTRGGGLRFEGRPREQEALGEEPLRVRVSRPLQQQEEGEVVQQEGSEYLLVCTTALI